MLQFAEMNGQDGAPVTRLLHEWRSGDQAALGKVADLVGHELRRLAQSYLCRERPGHTLQATALVNEAYLRLMAQNGQNDWQGRSHFLAIAAHHMRQILVDSARRSRAEKRGGGATMMDIEEAQVGREARSVDLLALDEALDQLARADARKAKAMELKYFGGLEMSEIAEALGISIKTVEKDVQIAKAWLRTSLAGGTARGGMR